MGRGVRAYYPDPSTAPVGSVRGGDPTNGHESNGSLGTRRALSGVCHGETVSKTDFGPSSVGSSELTHAFGHGSPLSKPSPALHFCSGPNAPTPKGGGQGASDPIVKICGKLRENCGAV